MAEIRLKPGDSLSWACTDTGDLTGTTIEAAVSGVGTQDDFYYALTVTETDLAAGEYTLSAASTATFPVGPLDCDIKYTIGGQVTYLPTFRFFVDKKVTK